MRFLITERTKHGPRCYMAIDDLGLQIDAAYDSGALGVTAMVKP